MRWLLSLFRRDVPTAPILVRVAEPCGRAPDSVDVEAHWFPSGARIRRRHITARGLCLIPWREGDERVELTVRAGTGQSQLTLSRAESHEGIARDLRLDPAA